jgi:hypothetical protein
MNFNGFLHFIWAFGYVGERGLLWGLRRFGVEFIF